MEGEYNDLDKIRCFMGSLTPEAEEEEVKNFLQEQNLEYCSVDIIAEKRTGVRKGCCFVTFQSKGDAEKAIDQLDGLVVFPGMRRTIVMKIANGDQDKLDWRVFVARIPKEMEDEELRPFFEPFGKIVTCIILRDFKKVSKGVAFVLYDKRSEAMTCVERGQEMMIPGHSYPFVVKMAETKEEKEDRKHSRSRAMSPPPAYATIPPSHPPAGAPPHYPYAAPAYGTPHYAPPPGATAVAPPAAPAPGAPAYPQAAAWPQQPPTTTYPPAFPTQQFPPPPQGYAYPEGYDASQAAASQAQAQAAALGAQAAALQAHAQAAALGAQGQQQQPQPTPEGVTNEEQPQTDGVQPGGEGGVEAPPAVDGVPPEAQGSPAIAAATPQFAQFAQIPGYPAAQPPPGFPAAATQTYAYSYPGYPGGQVAVPVALPVALPAAPLGAPMAPVAAPATSDPSQPYQHPQNCAVFIYRLPPTWTDTDLYTNFGYYGTIKSVKVMKDPSTGQPRGFGFVNYESPDAAQLAISAMNGLQIGSYRLSVALKSKGKPGQQPPY